MFINSIFQFINIVIIISVKNNSQKIIVLETNSAIDNYFFIIIT